MPLPSPVAIKLDLFTLACRTLLGRFSDLSDATQNDPRMDDALCVRVFDDVLGRFFLRAAPRNLRQAVDQWSAMLLADVAVLRTQNGAVAQVFDALVAGMRAQTATWRALDDLQHWHRQGRDLARRFFAASAWPATQARLNRTCTLQVEYGSNDDGRIGPGDMRVAPAAYHQQGWNTDAARLQAHIVLVRFDFRHTFASYLSYPFLLLHEYTAHVYSTDWDNDVFNDGWMVYAADAFLTRAWNADADSISLRREQAKIFQNYWYPGQLNPLPLRGCNLARDLDSWLSIVAPDRFAALTYELAAFTPSAQQPATWPTHAIFTLERAFRTDRALLLRALQTTPNARDLIQVLEK